MERDQRIQHGSKCHKCEQAGGDLADCVSEIEEANGQAAENDGEVQPAQKCTLIGEENFGLDAGWEGDAFAYVSLLDAPLVGLKWFVLTGSCLEERLA